MIFYIASHHCFYYEIAMLPTAANRLLALALALLVLAACGKSELIPLKVEHRSGASADDARASSWAQGTDITERFLTVYAGSFSNNVAKLQSLRFGKDGNYERVSGERVGSAICWLRTAGKVTSVIERNEIARAGYLPNASHVLLLWETSLELLEPETRCERLVRPNRVRATSQPLFAELLTNNSLRLARHNKTRTGASHDEVFTRTP